MERAGVRDNYFDDLTIVDENIDEAAGWNRIDDLPGLWERGLDRTASTRFWIVESRNGVYS